MRAIAGGFAVEFTKPVPEDVEFTMSSFTYRYSNSYGGPEINTKTHKIQKSSDHPSLYVLKVDDLRQYYVYELHAKIPGAETLKAYYTLNSLVNSK